MTPRRITIARRVAELKTEDMVRGPVRAAEILESRDGGKIWDSDSALALEEARARGWGKNKEGQIEKDQP